MGSDIPGAKLEKQSSAYYIHLYFTRVMSLLNLIRSLISLTYFTSVMSVLFIFT